MPVSKQVLLELLQQSRFLVNYKRLRLTSKARRAVSNALFQRQRKQFEKELMSLLSVHFDTALKSAMKQLTIKAGSLEGKTAKQIVDAIYDSSDWYDDLVNRCLPVMAKHMSEAAAGFFLTLGIDPRRKKSVRVKSTATDWLDSHDEAELPPGIATDLPLWMQEEISNQLQDTFSQPYWTEIDETTRNDIQSVLDNGLRNGVSIRDMAKAISESSLDYSLRRGRLVARTESGHALNGARDAAYTRMKNELPEEVSQHINKSWLSVLGNTTRDAHADLDGTEADENGMFNLNGVDIPWPGHVSLPASDRANCQCSLTTGFGSGAPPTEQIEELLVDAPEPTPEEEPAEEAPAQVEDVYDPDALLEERVNKHPGLNKIVQDILDAQAARSDELEVLANEIGADTLRHSALHDQLAKLIAQRVRGDLSMEEEERLREPLYQEWVKVRKERDAKQAKYDKINDEIRTEALKVMQVSPDKRASFSTSTEDLPGMRFAGETLVKATKEFKQKTKDATEFLSLLTAKRDGVDEIPVTFRQIRSGGRAFAIDNRSPVMAGVYCTGQDKTKIFVHEMGHMLENKLTLRRDVQEFRRYRIANAGTPTISMREATGINAYAENEKGNEDSFGRVFDRNAAFYAGKMYNDGSTEILSMGLEKMYENPVAFAKADPEYFKFVLGVLRGDL